MRTDRRIAVTLAATVLAGAAGAGAAQASPTAGSGAAPSSCRPANHTAKITEAAASSGHRHYRVTLTAPRGYEPCTLAGSPTDVRFSNDGSDSGVTAGRYGGQETAVTFGPGHPVHFDIQVPSAGLGTPANEASFTLRAPGGQIPGTSFAEGALTVADGTVIGPVQHGA
ncbi:MULTISPECIES: DUF4232 domain-containing protein [unclassified Streptomyces]|uniref:DUF4232 domain-containing protein n=1 Tax=unclassified Streptomyces TaxID=2593676 RepID=UPI002E79C370|nr:DUF4232 domain-containing protein [Streptomyces sp. JV176]MEE1802112.1 DUF4232 domain-containing protein [Streptomyces sp. JV176]